jgi:hypothetical protein
VLLELGVDDGPMVMKAKTTCRHVRSETNSQIARIASHCDHVVSMRMDLRSTDESKWQAHNSPRLIEK